MDSLDDYVRRDDTPDPALRAWWRGAYHGFFHFMFETKPAYVPPYHGNFRAQPLMIPGIHRDCSTGSESIVPTRSQSQTEGRGRLIEDRVLGLGITGAEFVEARGRGRCRSKFFSLQPHGGSRAIQSDCGFRGNVDVRSRYSFCEHRNSGLTMFLGRGEGKFNDRRDRCERVH